MALKVLVVDDSTFMISIIKNILNQNGVKDVIEAVDGLDAIKKYKETRPDLVFMDIMMPNKSGLEAIKEIKIINPNAKIVIITSVGKQKAFDEAMALGVQEYIHKPFAKEEIIKVIRDNL